MTWIEPLELETWMVNVFSGSPDIFLAVSLLVISMMAGYFRMTMMSMFLMLGIFLIMFTDYVKSPLGIVFAIVGGLVIGYWISKFVSR